MTMRALLNVLWTGLFAAAPALAQDPTGSIEGAVTDKTAAVVAGARVVATHLDTGLDEGRRRRRRRFLPAARSCRSASTASRSTRRSLRGSCSEPVQVNVSQTVRVNACSSSCRRSARPSR